MGRIRFPKVAFTYDFNTLFSNEDAFGPRIELIGRNRFFGENKGKDLTDRYTETMLGYAIGVGIGGYNIDALKKKGEDSYLNHSFLIFVLCYQNQSYFEPFAGIYPGVSWGVKRSFFVNPTAGINIKAFNFRRNWVSNYFQTYFQLRLEYNTSLSALFMGCGAILEFE